MHPSRILSFLSAAALTALSLAVFSPGVRAGQSAGASKDPLAAEIERWSAFLRTDAASRGIWAEVKQGGQPVLAHAEQDLRHGRRLLALHRFAMLKVDLTTATYVSERPADQHKDMARLEAEWTRVGKVLHASLGPPAAAALAGVQPAALRALGEVAVPQVREYYESSLDYARSALEGAQDEVASAKPDASPAASTAIVTDVLPSYFAALGPAPPEPPRLKPQVTVTLVRWPYT